MTTRILHMTLRHRLAFNLQSYSSGERSLLNKCLSKRTISSRSENTVKNDLKNEQKQKGLTPEDPLLVASPTSKCIVGCSCGADHPSVNWFYVTEGEPQTCSCGYFFKLVRTERSEWIPEYSQVMYVDEKTVDSRLHVQRDVPFKGFFSRFKTKSPKAPESMSRSDGKEQMS